MTQNTAEECMREPTLQWVIDNPVRCFNEMRILQARVAELEAMLTECADELRKEIEGRYPRYERDMDTVVRAGVILAKGREG